MTASRTSSLTHFGLTFSLLGLGLAACNGELSPPTSAGSPSPITIAPKATPMGCEPEPGDGSINAPEELVAAARQHLADRTGEDPATILITNATPVELPLVRTKLYSFKAIDRHSQPQTIALSEDGSQELNLDELEQAEQQRYRELNGNLTPDLARHLASLPDDAELEVVIQAVSDDDQASGPNRPEPSARLTEAQIDALYQAVDLHRGQRAETLTAPIRDKLSDLGWRESESDKLAPIVHVKLPVHAIREVSRWGNVSKVFAAETYTSEMQIARSVVEADVVNARGIGGSGVRVAEIEVGGIFAAANPFLSGTVQDAAFACLAQHATWVAGAIRSTHASVRGVSPNVSLRVGGSCSGNSAQLANRSSAASSWNARAFNLSFGSTAGTQPGGLDNYYDDLVQNGWRTVVVSAGNSGPSAIVGSPARAYNVISVGSTDDINTIPWLGDVMSFFSSSLNPVSQFGDREKPELVAPGSNIQTTSHSFPWIQDVVSGTSFSAPITTGLVALLMQRNTSLQVWPEAVKAILMTTAVHNIEGASRLSGRDGAGEVVGALADDVARGVSGNWGAQAYSCATPTLFTVANMSLVANRVVRVAIAWDTNPSYNQYSSRPSADLDLSVIGPGNTFVAGSASWDNTYEIVEFTAPSTGTYQIRVNKFSCSLTPKWLGWAWYHNY